MFTVTEEQREQFTAKLRDDVERVGIDVVRAHWYLDLESCLIYAEGQMEQEMRREVESELDPDASWDEKMDVLMSDVDYRHHELDDGPDENKILMGCAVLHQVHVRMDAPEKQAELHRRAQAKFDEDTELLRTAGVKV